MPALVLFATFPPTSKYIHPSSNSAMCTAYHHKCPAILCTTVVHFLQVQPRISWCCVVFSNWIYFWMPPSQIKTNTTKWYLKQIRDSHKWADIWNKSYPFQTACMFSEDCRSVAQRHLTDIKFLNDPCMSVHFKEETTG